MIHIQVDSTQRLANMRPHTATHLLHYFLEQTIWATKQAWSRVGNDELRFDFACTTALTHQELTSIEQQINRVIMADYPVQIATMSHSDAIKLGAKAFFDDKYGDEVRVVSCIGTDLRSIELCGGTHVSSTGHIWAFKIITQESVASGIRRIVAYTGTKVTDYARTKDTELLGIAMMLDCQVKQIPEKLEKTLKAYNSLRQSYQQLEYKLISNTFASMTPRVHNDIPLVFGIDDELNRTAIIDYAKHQYAHTTWCIYRSDGSFALGSHDNKAKIIADKLWLSGWGRDQLIQGKDTAIKSKLFGV